MCNEKKLNNDELEKVTGGVLTMPATPTEQYIKETIRTLKMKGNSEEQIITYFRAAYGSKPQLMKWIEKLVHTYYPMIDKNGMMTGK